MPTRTRPLGVAVVVHNVDARGGMERQAVRLARGLAARGARVTLLSTFSPRGLALARPRRTLEEGVEVLRFPLFWWTFAGAPRLFEAWAAWTVLRRRARIDVIYAVHHKTGSQLAPAARLARRPLAVKFACAGEPGDFASIRREPERARYEALIREAHRYLCLSREIEDEARAAGLDPARFVRVRNGVDLARFAARGRKGRHLDRPSGSLTGDDRPIPAERPVVLFVGRLDAQKRVDALLHAMAELRRRGVRARLAVAGAGPLERELRALADELGLDATATFLGGRDDVPELLAQASVFVLPSSAEGLSNALLEALAAGVPVVATAIPANESIVAHEREALLVPPGDARALADAIARLLGDPELAARLVRAGHERVAAEFDLERVVARHEELFWELRVSREASPGRGSPGTLVGLAGLILAALAKTLASATPHAVARLSRGARPTSSQSQANK